MQENQNIIESLDFCNEINNELVCVLKDKLNSLFDFLPEFIKKYNEELEKIPYHINLIDELHANENAHSRILEKLLNANDKDRYCILRSFLQHLGSPFSELSDEVVNKIETQKDNIDVRVRGKSYSLIIENKIHYAQEQKEQIKRYIENEMGWCGINNIYVLNIGRYRNDEPSEYSFP